MFNNNADKKNNVNYSRYIASWLNVTRDTYMNRGSRFNKWLESLDLDEEDIDNILELATTGKMELEYSIKQFLLVK